MINFVKTLHKNLQNLEAPMKTYALAQVRQVLTLDDFAAHIASHNSKYGKGDIYCVLTEMVECMREQMLNGNKVQLGDLGSFWLKLGSHGVCESVVDAETGEKPVFTAKNINRIQVKWYKGSAFDSASLMNDATFQEVETRKATAEALKEKGDKIAAGTYAKNQNGE